MTEWLPGDASTLIYLAKADAFRPAARCVGGILASPSVWQEAVEEGERIGASEVPRIREAAESGFLRQCELSSAERALADTIASEYRLGLGESEFLALGRLAGRVLVDEGRASRVAQVLGIVPISTLFLPFLGNKHGTLDSDGALDLLRRLAVVTGARAEAVYVIEQHIRKERS